MHSESIGRSPEKQKPESSIDEINRASSNDGLQDEWHERGFNQRPDLFFADDNYEWLATKTPAERVVMLLTASPRLTVSPQMYEKHFARFPEDRTLLADFAVRKWGDIPSNQWLQSLVTVVTPALVAERPEMQDFPYIEEGFRKAERRREAPAALLNTADIAETIFVIDSFGEAAEPYKQMYQRVVSAPYGLNQVVDARTLFSHEAFVQLQPEQKATLVRACLVHLQYATVEGEVYYSAFSKEGVESNRARRMERASLPDWLGVPRRGLMGHDVAHSVLFHTYQPQSVYELDVDLLDIESRRSRRSGGAVEEYALQRMILETIRQLGLLDVGIEENTDVITAFWEKNRNPILGAQVADSLSQLDPARAAGQLMRLIREDTWNPESLAAVLYRLELGQIGISEEGVRYLGRLYDLGEYNNPMFFVHRLTSKGDVGVFDEHRRLQGRFSLGDLTHDATSTRAEVLAITEELLFSDQATQNQVPELVREELLRTFQEQYFDFYASNFFGDQTNIQFNNLEFQEQGWFLYFMHHGDPELRTRALDMVSRFGEGALRTFLSLQYDRSLGERVVDRSESLVAQNRGALMQQICNAYSSLVRVARVAGRHLHATYAITGDNVAEKITTRLLKSATDVLAQSTDHTENPEHLLQMLDSIHVDSQFLIAEYRELLEQGIVKNIEDIEKITRETLAGEAARALLPQIEHIYRENWASESEAFIEELLARFHTKLEKPDTKLHVIRMDDMLLAFMVEVPHGETGVELSALNTNKRLKATEPGLLLFNRVVESRVAEQKTVHLDAPPVNAQVYINKYGFVGTGVTELGGNVLVLAERNDAAVYSKDIVKKVITDVRTIPDVLQSEGGPYVISRMRIKGTDIELTLTRRE